MTPADVARELGTNPTSTRVGMHQSGWFEQTDRQNVKSPQQLTEAGRAAVAGTTTPASPS